MVLWLLRVVYPIFGFTADFAVALFILLAAFQAARGRSISLLVWLVPLAIGDIMQLVGYGAVLALGYDRFRGMAVYAALYLVQAIAYLIVVYAAMRMWLAIKTGLLSSSFTQSEAPAAWPRAPNQ